MKPDPWTHFHEAFRHFDQGWRAADRGFDSVRVTADKETNGKVHTLTASTWRSRIRMFRLFNRLAWRLLFRGRVTIKL